MGLLEDFAGQFLDWKTRTRKTIERNASNPAGLLASFAQDVQQGAAADKSAWDASRSVMPGVREAGIREMNARGQELGGLLGTFAGVGAKTADVAKLEQAKKMAKAGADPVDVWKQTGWTDQFPDGKWRFEISDDKATKKRHYFTPKQAYAEARTSAFIDGNQETLKRVQAMAPYSNKTTKELVNEYSKTGKAIADAALGGDMERALALNDARNGLSGLLSQMHQRPYGPASAYIRHTDLRAAYPDVATMHTRTYADDLGDANAAYLRKDNGRGEQIAYHAGAPDKSTFLHESQHAIQQREGFARGGNPENAADWPEVQQLALKLSKEMEAARAAGDKQTYSKLYDKVYRLVGQDGYEAYKSLAGEAEARLTQSRMNLTPAERAARPPWLEFDVPREEQIVRGLLGEPTGPAMSVAPSKFDFANPGGGSRTAKIGDTEITYGVGKNGIVDVILVKTAKSKRGEGSARNAMEQLVKEADANNLRLALNAEPMDKGVTQGGLEAFYKSLGFRKNTGRKADFDTTSGWVRDPQQRTLQQEPQGLLARDPTKFQLAHAEAQRNAALPVEQGGLGLGPQNTAMERAKAMGFEDGWYHGTGGEDWAEFDPIKATRSYMGKGSHLAKSPELASRYAEQWKRNQRVLPVMHRATPFDLANETEYRTADWKIRAANDDASFAKQPQPFPNEENAIKEELQKRLFKGVAYQHPPEMTSSGMDKSAVTIFDPRLIRSRFAAFDPKKKDSRDLLASMGLLGLLGAGAYGQDSP